VAALRLLQWLLAGGRWVPLPAAEPALRPLLLRLCAAYLYRERRRGSALDPVAHFHLRNGALLWRINWRADLSAEGLRRSHGLMVRSRGGGSPAPA
jgi:malonyl-CoA decarboxylase